MHEQNAPDLPKDDGEHQNQEAREFESEICAALYDKLGHTEHVPEQDLKEFVRNFRMRVEAFRRKSNASRKTPEKKSGNDKRTLLALESEEWGLYLIKKTWQRNRTGISGPKLHNFRWNLYAFAKFLLGSEKAGTLRLPFLPVRKLAVPLSKIEGFPLDIAHEILWKVRSSPPTKRHSRKARSAARLLFELLWQGLPVRESLKLTAPCFDPVKRLLYVPYSRAGKGSRPVVLSAEAWQFMRGPLRHLISWQRSWKKREPLTLGDLVGRASASRLLDSFLRDAAKALNLSKKISINQEKFRNAGILHRILSQDLTPAAASAFFGPELPTNVMGPVRMYQLGSKKDRYPLVSKSKTRQSLHLENQIEQAESADPQVKPITSRRESPLWNLVSECRKRLREYHDVLRLRMDRRGLQRFRRELGRNFLEWQRKAQGYCKDTDFSWPYLFQWLSILACGRNWLRPRSLARYMDTVINVLDYCDIHDLDLTDLDTDHVRNIMADEHGDIHRSGYKNTKDGLDGFLRYLKLRSIPLPNINWWALRSYVNPSPGVIEIPRRKDIERRIIKLYRKDIRQQEAALVGLLAGLLGLRQEEIVNVRLEDVRLLNGSDDYIVVKEGKGGKERRVFLFLLSSGMKRIFVDACENAVVRRKTTGRDRLLPRINTASGVTSLCKAFWSDIAPDGPHSLRHAFATHQLAAGRRILDVSESLGHATYRTTQVTYNQGSWISARRRMSNFKLPERAPHRQVTLKELGSMSMYAHSGILRKVSAEAGYKLRQRIRDRAYRKTGNVEWMIPDHKRALDTFLGQQEQSLNRIPGPVRAMHLWEKAEI